MNVYNGYEYEYTSDGYVVLFLNDGSTVEFESDDELYRYVDEILDEILDRAEEEPVRFYLYRIRKDDFDSYDNYQYYNGKTFMYGGDISLMTEKEAKKLRDKFRIRRDSYNYHIGKKKSLR